MTAGASRGFGPTAAEAAWDSYRTDSAVHRTYWIAQWPRLAVGPAFLAPLLVSAQVVRSVAVTFEPVPPSRARRAVEAAATSEEADEQLRAERGFRTTARRSSSAGRRSERERELAEGHQELRFAGFVTVSARDADELEIACDEVEQAAHQAYLDIQPLYGAAGRRVYPGRPPHRPRIPALDPARRDLMRARAPIGRAGGTPRDDGDRPGHLPVRRRGRPGRPGRLRRPRPLRRLVLLRRVRALPQRVLTNPNVLVIGAVGSAKSALVKTYLYRQAVFGRIPWITDPKGEYGPLARALGSSRSASCLVAASR